MIKHLLALAIGAALSCNAFAGYIRYDFSGPLSGYFVQKDDDQSISYFYIGVPIKGYPRDQPFVLNLQPIGGEGSTRLTAASTYFRNNGPTNFHIYSDFGADQFTHFDISFSRGVQGNFNYAVSYNSIIYGCHATGCGFEGFSGSHAGSASVGTVNPDFAAFLDRNGGYYDGVRAIVPGFIPGRGVPEPGSVALLALGAVGLMQARRKQRSASLSHA